MEADVVVLCVAGVSTGGGAGWGFLLVEPEGFVEEGSGGEPDAAALRMLAQATLAGLRQISSGQAVAVRTSSQALVQLGERSIPAWRAAGWQPAADIPDLDLARALSRQLLRLDVQWVHTGYSPLPPDQRAQALAREAAARSAPEEDLGREEDIDAVFRDTHADTETDAGADAGEDPAPAPGAPAEAAEVVEIQEVKPAEPPEPAPEPAAEAPSAPEPAPGPEKPAKGRARKAGKRAKKAEAEPPPLAAPPPEPVPEPQTEPRPAPAPPIEVAPEPEIGAPPAPEAEPAPPPEPEPEPPAAAEPEPEPDPAGTEEPVPEPDPMGMEKPAPEPEPEVQEDPAPEPEPEVQEDPAPEPEPEVQEEPAPEPEPEPPVEPISEPEPGPALEAEPAPEPEAAPEPEPAREEEPPLEPEPEIRSEPAPEAQALLFRESATEAPIPVDSGVGFGAGADVPVDIGPRLVAYIDGRTAREPGPGGWGFLLIDKRTGRALARRGGERWSTTARMELVAAIQALSSLKGRQEIELRADARAIVQLGQDWLPTWRRRGWVKRGGQEIQNLDLVRQLDALQREHQVSWRWVPEHCGEAGNAFADGLSAAAIESLRMGEDPEKTERFAESPVDEVL